MWVLLCGGRYCWPHGRDVLVPRRLYEGLGQGDLGHDAADLLLIVGFLLWVVPSYSDHSMATVSGRGHVPCPADDQLGEPLLELVHRNKEAPVFNETGVFFALKIAHKGVLRKYWTASVAAEKSCLMMRQTGFVREYLIDEYR